MSPTSNHLHDMTVCYHDDKCHKHPSHPIMSPYPILFRITNRCLGVSACADVSAETTRSPSRSVFFLIIIFWQAVLCFCVSARACVRIVAGQWQLKKRTVFVEEQHGCREEWRSWGRPNGSTPSCTEIKTHNKRVCSPSGPVHVALMEAKAAQSVNDQEPWRSPQRGRHAIKVTDGSTTAAASWRRSKSPSINSDWNGHRSLKKSVCQSNCGSLLKQGEHTAVRPSTAWFPYFPSDWAWTVIFLQLSSRLVPAWASWLPGWAILLGENWEHDAANVGQYQRMVGEYH